MVCKVMFVFAVSILLAGCAKLEFYEQPTSGALSYWEPAHYMFVSTTKDCVSTATVVSLPGRKKAVGLETGYGSAELSVNLNNGMITSVGQKTDTKIPETITALTGAATAAAGFMHTAQAGKQVVCKPTAQLYPIYAGVPSDKPIRDWTVKTELINSATEK